jgi:hypothetical protein
MVNQIHSTPPGDGAGGSHVVRAPRSEKEVFLMESGAPPDDLGPLWAGEILSGQNVGLTN